MERFLVVTGAAYQELALPAPLLGIVLDYVFDPPPALRPPQ